MRYFKGYFYLILIHSFIVSALPSTLKETGFFDLKKISYTPQYPLWSDGAIKSRWIYLPDNTQINTENPDYWIYPVGTKLWKEFATLKNGKKIKFETRYLEKISEEEWEAATYLWDTEEKNALLAPEEGIANYLPSSPSTTFDIPGIADCFRCHKNGGDPVLGFDAIQLSTSKDPNALHSEVKKPEDTDLKKLIDEKILSHNHTSFQNGAPIIPSSNEKNRILYGYLHANCASCHNPQSSAPHIRMNLRFSLKANSENELPVFLTAVEKTTTVVNFPNQEKTFRVKKGSPEESAMFRLMNEKTNHMPAIGADIIDQPAVNLLKEWILKIQ